MQHHLNIERDAVATRKAFATRERLAELLFKNDQDYFRAGAEIYEAEGWRVVRIAGYPRLAAACVLEAPRGQTVPPKQVLEHLQSLNIETVRFYCPNTAAPEASNSSAFELTREVAYLLDANTSNISQPNTDLIVRPLKSTEDPIKVELYASRSGGPDGKHSNPFDYVALERLKIDAGYMQGYIIEDRGVPSACFGLSVTHNVVRMKNLLTSSHARGRGCGAAIVHHAVKIARELNKRHVGVFAIENGGGQRLYERHGMEQIGIQTEYSAPLASFISEGKICQK